MFPWWYCMTTVSIQLPSEQLPQVLHGAIQLGDLLAGHGGRCDIALLRQLLPQRLGEIGHLVKGGDAPMEPGKDLLAPEGRLPHLFQGSRHLLQCLGFQIGHRSSSGYLPLHAADVKAVGTVALGPEGQLPLRLPYRRRQGEAVPGRNPLCSARNASVTCSFSSGRMVQVEYTSTPPGATYRAALSSMRRLDHRQGEQIVGLFVADVRLLPDDAQAGTGSVHQHRVKPLRPFRAERPAVVRRRW